MAPIFQPLPAGSVATIATGSDLYDLPAGAILRRTTAEVVRDVLVMTQNDHWYGLVTLNDNRLVFTQNANVSNVHVPPPPVVNPPPPVVVPDGLDAILTELVTRLIPIIEGMKP